MAFPLAVALIAVFLGTWLALFRPASPRALTAVRRVSVAAALLVIATHLLPEALHGLGALALIGFAAGAALPAILAHVGRLLTPHGQVASVVALEISYAGLVIHRFGDGLSMGAYATGKDGFLPIAAVVLALAAHIVPVTTVMLLAVASLRGRQAALVHGFILAAATMAGVALAFVAMGNEPAPAAAWISAIVAGLLLHVVAHPGGAAHAEHASRPPLRPTPPDAG